MHFKKLSLWSNARLMLFSLVIGVASIDRKHHLLTILFIDFDICLLPNISRQILRNTKDEVW